MPHPNNWALYQSGQLHRLRPTKPVRRPGPHGFFDTFSGGGAGKVPVRRFAGFYVTGWSSASNACANAAGNERSAARNTRPSSNKAEVWGHFVNYVADAEQQTTPALTCAHSPASDLCVAVLTR